MDGKKTLTYSIHIDMTIHTPNGVDLEAVMCHAALCFETPDDPNRLGVVFRGGSLAPTYAVQNDPALLEVWQETFAGAYKKAAEQRSFMSGLMQKALGAALQLSFPTDEDVSKAEDHSVSFEMKRSPKGYIDVLYLDQDLRITRGNRGTIVVVQRLATTQRMFELN